MSRAGRLISSALVLWGLAAPVSAQAPAAASQSLASQVDEIFSAFRPDGPGCAVAVYQNAKIVLATGYGSANLEYGIPITPATPFIVGSVSKQFTAAAIALLVEEKRLALTVRTTTENTAAAVVRYQPRATRRAGRGRLSARTRMLG
ncbi:MAG: serine hydrolase [Acidobacteriota bacterium]|nr:serine hydrolase [Acidobacteriota bacterium]